jgi:predicted anti-sigma-YlaC factor YlaD
MSHCERMELSLSVMMDGELEAAELLPAVDHLARCASCRAFYRDARALDSRVLEAGNAAEPQAPLASAAVWDRIRAETHPATGTARASGVRWRVWGSVAAALLIVAVGLAGARLWQAGAPARGENGPVVVVLGQDSGRMSDERFVELASELLRAGPRYHERMHEVMELVLRKETEREGAMEQRRRDERSGGEGARPRADEPENGAIQAVLSRGQS